MRFVELTSDVDRLDDMNRVYGRFDLDINTGRPNDMWERRNLMSLRLMWPLQNVWFPEVWHLKIQVNRLAADSLAKIFIAMFDTFGLETLNKEGLSQFVRCYCFGCKPPSLFWYGAAWELSPKVTGESLAAVTKIFLQHGWSYPGLDDRKRNREFEYWG